MPPPDVVHVPYPNTVAANVPNVPRVVARRGSLSAPDPFGEHSTEDKPRHVRSRLTVLRIPNETVDMSSPATHAGVARHTRAFSTPSPRGRLSFSTASFSANGDDATRRHSYTSSRPEVARRNSGSMIRRPKLSAHQICDLASTSLAAPTAQPAAPMESAFRRVPASYYLPFLDRPAEIKALLSTNSNARLMTLLSLTFSVYNRDKLGDYATQEPSAWSYATLYKYMTEVDRSTANDIEWLHKVRKCIRTHSEIMWERIKDVLGVLPELDSDDPFYRYGTPEEALEVAVDMRDQKTPSPDESTDFGVNDAWLEPMYVLTEEEREIERRSTMGPGGMETIGEEEEDKALIKEPDDAQVAVIQEFKTQTTDEELMASRMIRSLRMQTDYLFVRGTTPHEKKLERISTSDSARSVSTTVPRIEVTEPSGENIQTLSPVSYLSPETSSPPTPPSPSRSPPKTRSPPQIRRWSTAPSMPTYIPPIKEEPEIEMMGEDDEDKIIPQPTQTVFVTPITVPPPGAMERRRHSVAVEPRFPTTFASLQGKQPLAQRVVHAGVVH